jgi:hypothetical protein
MPYRDFPFFHAPNILFVYSVLFSFTSHLLLASRLFSAACAVLTAILIFITALRLWNGPRNWTSLLTAAFGVLLIVSQPLYLCTTGLAWNHDFPMLLLLLAVLAHCGWMRTGRGRLLFLGAVLLGLAAGSRLSYVPPIAAFAGAVLFMKRGAARWKSLAVFAVGMTASLIPSAAMFALSPSAFLFGNLGYPRLSLIYAREILHQRPFTQAGKLVYVRHLLLEQHAALLLLVLLFLVILFLCVRRKASAQLELAFVTTVAFCCLLGSLAPTPPNPQYYYQPIPFLVLGIIFGIVSLYAQAKNGNRKLAGPLLAVAVAVISIARCKLMAACIGLVFLSCFHAGRQANSGSFVAEDAHQLGLQARACVGSGKVLTLAPIYPLEGGLDIYPEFSTGPFAWRTAFMLSATDRLRFKMVSATDLDELLRTDPPSGILAGVEDEQMEYPLIQYAKQHNYVQLPMSKGLTVWVPRPQR